MPTAPLSDIVDDRPGPGNPSRPSGWAFSGPLRGGLVFAAFLALTLPLMPVQAILKRTSTRSARLFPHWYHRQVCRILGIRISVHGQLAPNNSVLLVSNHSSWLDIPILSAVAPVSFVAKREVGGWPGVGILARLQRTVFVDRTRRTATGRTTGEIAERLAAGDNVVLFAEGTSTDGNRVLPFRSSLFGAAIPNSTTVGDAAPVLQTVSIVYTHIHGVPLSRADRPLTAWYGDMDMLPHGWGVLQAGPLNVVVAIGTPVQLAAGVDRKALAHEAQQAVRQEVAKLLRDARS